jgi:hypothetical protein
MGPSSPNRDEEAKEFALLLWRQQQLEQTPEMTTEGLLDLRQHHVLIDNDHDDDDDDDEAFLDARDASAAAAHLLSGMSISYNQDQFLVRPSSADTTSLDDTILEEEDEIMPCRSSVNAPPTTLAHVPKSSTHRSALALFWEGGLLYTVCLVLPTMLHWLLYDDSGNLWVAVAYKSTRNALYDSLAQWALQAHDVLCAHMNCPEWHKYAQEQWDPVVEYLCESDEIDPFGFYGVRSYETKVQDYVSPSYWAHRLGLCPIVEVEEVLPLPVVSPDITGWEHDVQIIFALSLVLTILRQIVGLFLTEWSPPPEDTNRAMNVETKADRSTEPLYLQVVVRVPSDQFRSDEPTNADIVVSPTEETERVVNIKQRSRRLALNVRDVDEQSTGAYSERSQSSRSVRSTRSIRSAMSATNRRIRGLRNRLFKGKKQSSRLLLGSADSICSRAETNVEFDNAEHPAGNAHHAQEQIASANSSLSDELPDTTNDMNQMNDSMNEDPQRHVWVGSVQAGGSPARANARRAAPPSPTASLDSSISTKHDLRPGSDTDRNSTWSLENATIPDEKTAPVKHPGRQTFVAEPQVDVTELFLLLCSMVAVTQAWFSLRDSNFWPWYVGGHGNTANCWDLSGGLSVGMDSDFDHRNAVLKQYFLGQASFHWYSATLHLLGMLLSQWQRCVAPPKATALRNETVARAATSHGRDLVQHVLVLVIFAVAFIFSSLRRLVAIGVFAFDANKLCLHLYGTLSSNRATMGMAREMYWCLVLPSFVVARFAIWPALWYSATFESSDWLTQLEQTLWPGSADTFRVSCHVGMFLLLLVSLLDLRRIVIRHHVFGVSLMKQREIWLERKNV